MSASHPEDVVQGDELGRVACCSEAGLRRRGSLTLWVTEQAIDAWRAAPRSTPGGQATYSDSAIQTCLMLRAAFKLALRQAEGLMMSFVELLGRELAVPDHTTVSRRAIRLASITRQTLPEGPLHVLIDSTGLKIEIVRVRRGMAGRQTRPAHPPRLAQAALGRGCRQRPDRGRHVDRPGCR